MKKHLLLLPLVGLLLTGCGEPAEGPVPNEGLPAGGTEIDLKDPDQAKKAGEKLADDIKITYQSALTGFEIEGSFKVDQFSLVIEETTVKGIDLGFDYSLKANNLQSKLSDWEIAIEVSKFNGQVVINEEIPEAKKIFKATDVSFGIYLDNAIVYADFSNNAFENLANSIIDYVVPASNLEAVYLAVTPLFNKVKLVDLVSTFGIDDEQYIPTVTDEMFLELKEEITEGVEELLEYQTSPVAVYDYDGNGLGMLVQYGDGFENMYTDDYGFHQIKQDMLITGDVLFSKAGNLQKINIKESIDNESKKDGKIESKEKISSEEFATFTYGTGAVEFPDFSTFVESDIISLILEIVSSSDSATIVGVAPEEHNIMI